MKLQLNLDGKVVIGNYFDKVGEVLSVTQLSSSYTDCCVSGFHCHVPFHLVSLTMESTGPCLAITIYGSALGPDCNHIMTVYRSGHTLLCQVLNLPSTSFDYLCPIQIEWLDVNTFLTQLKADLWLSDAAMHIPFPLFSPIETCSFEYDNDEILACTHSYFTSFIFIEAKQSLLQDLAIELFIIPGNESLFVYGKDSTILLSSDDDFVIAAIPLDSDKCLNPTKWLKSLYKQSKRNPTDWFENYEGPYRTNVMITTKTVINTYYRPMLLRHHHVYTRRFPEAFRLQ